MAKVKYKTRDPQSGETSWYEQEVPDDASAQDVIDHIEGTYKRQVLELERQTSVGREIKEAGKAVARGVLRAGAFGAEMLGKQPSAEDPGASLIPKPGTYSARIEEWIKGNIPRHPDDKGPLTSVLEGVGGGAMAPGQSLPRALISGGLAGGGGWAGQRLMPGNPLAEAVGSLAGGAAGVVGAHAKTNAPALAQQALEGLSPEQLAQAKARMAFLEKQGYPANLSQGLVESSNVDDLVNALAYSRHGDNTIWNLRFQPKKLAVQAQGELKDSSAKLGVTPSSSQDIANRSQEAATTAISEARKRANAAYVGALVPGAKVPEPMLDAFERRLDAIIEANTNNASAQGLARAVKERLRLAESAAPPPQPVGKGAVTSKVVKLEPLEKQLERRGQTLNTEGEVIAAFNKGDKIFVFHEQDGAPMLVKTAKELRQRLDAYVPDQFMRLPKAGAPQWLDDPAKLKGAVDDAIQSFGANSLNTQAARADLNRYAEQIRTAWKETVRAGTPGMENAAAAARKVYESEVNPMRKSVTGRVAGVSGASEVKEATDKLTRLFREGTETTARYSEILTFEKDIRAKHPKLFAEAVATDLAERITQHLPTSNTAVKQSFPIDLKKALMATPAQERGLKDMLAGAARSAGVEEKPVVDGFMNFMRITELLQKQPARISGLPLLDMARESEKSTISAALRPAFEASQKLRMVLSSDAYRTMDRLVNSSEGLEMLQKLGKTSIMKPEAQAAVAAFFGAQGQQDGQK